MKEQKFQINRYGWMNNGYEPKVEFHLQVEEKGFHMHIVAWERNPLRNKTKHFEPVNLDSCVEWFVKFAPDICDRYFNFEINPNGVINFAFKKDRYDSTDLTIEDAESLNIQASVYEEYWEVDYLVPFTLIQKYIPGYEYQEGMTILTNFYKCGDEMEYPHYGMWNLVGTENPDFHRPEYFKEVVV